MSLFKQIETDYITAYKAKDTVKVAVLRHLKTAIKKPHDRGQGRRLAR